MRRAARLAFALAVSLTACGRASSFDAEAMRTIPLMDVIRLATIRYDIILFEDDKQKVRTLAEIAALDPKVQTLIWLAVLEQGLTERTAENSDDPTSFVSNGYFLSRIRAALADAGMAGRAAIFAAATAGRQEPAIEPDRPPRDDWSGYKSPDLIRLGPGFGDKGAFDDALVAFAEATPSVRAWCDAQRQALSDKDRLEGLFTLLGRVPGASDLATLATWPQPYRVIRLVEIYNDEMLNGGVHQYFLNSSGDLAPATVEALRVMGLPKQAAVIETGMSSFEQPYPTDRDRRFRAFDHEGTNAWDDALDALTGQADDGTIEPASIAYAKREGVLPR